MIEEESPPRARGVVSSVLSTRTRLAPLSAAESTSMGSSRSWRGAIVTLHALAEFCFSDCSQYKYSTVPSTPTVRQQYGTVQR
eukprot:scaffold11828_cov112-Isochrysis_galbana.AAC.1